MLPDQGQERDGDFLGFGFFDVIGLRVARIEQEVRGRWLIRLVCGLLEQERVDWTCLETHQNLGGLIDRIPLLALIIPIQRLGDPILPGPVARPTYVELISFRSFLTHTEQVKEKAGQRSRLGVTWA
jgi:hypothetical protein